MIGIIIVIGLLIAGFVIPREIKPSDSTRIILEHTEKTYIAPACFEESNPSNFLEDSTLEEAYSLNYDSHSSCTVDELESEENSFIISLLMEWGILNKPWDSW